MFKFRQMALSNTCDLLSLHSLFSVISQNPIQVQGSLLPYFPLSSNTHPSSAAHLLPSLAPFQINAPRTTADIPHITQYAHHTVQYKCIHNRNPSLTPPTTSIASPAPTAPNIRLGHLFTCVRGSLSRTIGSLCNNPPPVSYLRKYRTVVRCDAM